MHQGRSARRLIGGVLVGAVCALGCGRIGFERLDAGPGDGGAQAERTCGDDAECTIECSTTCDSVCRPRSECTVEAVGGDRLGVECESEASCAVNASSMETVHATCASAASCEVDCADSAECSVDCSSGASCGLTCSESSSCTMTCASGAACALECGGASECALAGCAAEDLNDCGGGTWTCRRACPPS